MISGGDASVWEVGTYLVRMSETARKASRIYKTE